MTPIHPSISQAKLARINMGTVVAELAFTVEEMKATIETVAVSYQSDAGAALLRDAFGPET